MTPDPNSYPSTATIPGMCLARIHCLSTSLEKTIGDPEGI